MSLDSLSLHRRMTNTILPRQGRSLERWCARLSDGAWATVHVAGFEQSVYVPRVVALERPTPLVRWCTEHGVRHALVGGFFLRPQYAPLGELRIAGEAQNSIPFTAPWGEVRACLQISDGVPRIAPRATLGPDPGGDVLQAGPLLVAHGRRVVSDGQDPEGFSAGAQQFDSDITLGRYPRAALAVARGRVLAMACDGRARGDAGMTLPELADVLIELGATEALNLDGGGSATLVYEGRLRNRPREEHGAELLEGRPVVTAVVFQTA